MLGIALALAAATTSPIIERNKFVVAQYYPKDSIQRGEEGDVVFRMRTNRDGRVDSCQIVKSSGYARLDKATCDLILVGATAVPLENGQGMKVAGNRDGLVQWRLPDGVARPVVQPIFDTLVNRAGEPIECRRQTRTGSIWRMQKVCLTAEDWKRQSEYAQSQTYAMQNPTGNGVGF